MLWDAISASRAEGTLALDTIMITSEGTSRWLTTGSMRMSNTESGIPDTEGTFLGENWPTRMVVLKGDVYSDWGEGYFTLERAGKVDYFTAASYLESILNALRATGDLAHADPGQFAGEPVDRYRGTLAPSFVASWLDSDLTDAHRGTVEYWVDPEGRLVQTELDMTDDTTRLWVVRTLGGFGDPVTVEAPPADQIRTGE